MLKNAINYRETHYHFSLSLEWTLNFKVIHYHYKGSIWTNKEKKKVAATSAAVAKAILPLVLLFLLAAAVPTPRSRRWLSPTLCQELCLVLYLLHALSSQSLYQIVFSFYKASPLQKRLKEVKELIQGHSSSIAELRFELGSLTKKLDLFPTDQAASLWQ